MIQKKSQGELPADTIELQWVLSSVEVTRWISVHAVPGTILYVVVWTQNWWGTNTDGFNNV